MFDIKKMDFAEAAELGHEFELTLPNGVSSGAYLTVIGDKSKTVKGYSRKKFQEYQMKAQIAKRKGKEVEELSLDEAEELAIEAALVRLIGWRGFTEDGKEVKFSKEKAQEVLKQHSFVREAIMEVASDVTLFSPK